MFISAPRQRVWDVMLGPEGFKRWTSDFAEGSYYEGSWEQGQKIRFLTPEGEGMFSTIEESRPYEFVSIHRLGTVKNGSEDTQSEEARQWGDAGEKYEFRDVADGTEVVVDVDTPEEMEAFMRETWPKALGRLKATCEAHA
jgi:uncharacterized protein YndB with AHSA1/START domain